MKTSKMGIRRKSKNRIHNSDLLKLEDGRVMSPGVYMRLLAKGMPPMEEPIDEHTTRPVNHLAYLSEFYHKDGLEGIRQYAKMVDEIQARDMPKLKQALDERKGTPQ